MNILSVDTSTQVATVSYSMGERLICEKIINNKLTHSEKLMPMIDEVLRESDAGVEDIDLFVVCIGPGSFTGLRIGISAIKAMAQALEKPCVEVDTLMGLSYNFFGYSGILCPMIDARNNSVYNGLYRFADGNIVEINKPRQISIDELICEIKNLGETVYALGDGAEKYQQEIAGLVTTAPFNMNLQRASSFAVCGYNKYQKGEITTYSDISPIYISIPQAERELAQKAQISE